MSVLFERLIKYLERLRGERRAPLPLLGAIGAEQVGEILLVAGLEPIRKTKPHKKFRLPFTSGLST